MSSAVRIVVAQPAVPTPGMAPGTVEALEGLGCETGIAVVHDVRACAECCGASEVDLLVVDRALGAEYERILEAGRGGGPPIVVVGRDASDAAALDAFRRGASECVAAGSEYAEVLRAVALEQVRRWRRIRERGTAEQLLYDLERSGENIIQNMNSALLVVDTEGKITSCNPAAEQILGRPAEALRGRSVLDWFRDDAGGAGPVARTLSEEVRFKGAESFITRPDGSAAPIGISCAPILDADGNKLGAVAIFQDLTEVKQLRDQVLQAEKMASIGQLAAGVAHEINNPMGFIHANLFQMAEYLADLRRAWSGVEDLQKSLSRGDPEEVRCLSQELAAMAEEVDVPFVLSDFAKAIRESQEGSERIRHIVRDLREFSHHESSERGLADVNQCLDSTANIVWPMMKHLVVLEKEYRELPSIYCFPMQLKQVFLNLLVNAFQAIEQRVEGRGGTGRILLQTALLGQRVVVSVTDDGVGIPPENRDRIFEPFFTTKKVGSGTGLGLSTSYSIVRRHGGTLSVESRPGKGTTFHVFLPLRAGDEFDEGD